jgi:indolepyruvate ferredoxin oxidoreductase beta subunit
MLSTNGWLISNIHPEENIPDYPVMDDLLAEIRKVPQHIALDALKIAREAGSPKTANIVTLGASSAFLGMEYESLKQAIRSIFLNKGDDIIEMNLQALDAGRDFAQQYVKA